MCCSHNSNPTILATPSIFPLTPCPDSFHDPTLLKEEFSPSNNLTRQNIPTLCNFFLSHKEPIHSVHLAGQDKKASASNKQKSQVNLLRYAPNNRSHEVSLITLDMRKKSDSGKNMCEAKGKISEKTIQQKRHPVKQRGGSRLQKIAQEKNILGLIKQHEAINTRKMGSNERSMIKYMKKSADWKIIHSNTSNDGREQARAMQSQQDSIQYINDYYKSQTTKQHGETDLELIRPGPRATFGKSQRFDRVRPRTAQVSYCNPSNLALGKEKSKGPISFLTSKSNPRSGVKKLQYCDWIRPHAYQQPLIPNSLNRQHACFQSNIQRFKEVRPNYPGSGFYLFSCQQNAHNELPSYYFRSDVPKCRNSARPKENIQNSFVYVSLENPKKTCQTSAIRRVHKLKQNEKKQKVFNSKQFQLENDMQVETTIRKNSLGQRKRIPCFENGRRTENERKIIVIQKEQKSKLPSKKAKQKLKNWRD